MYQIETTGTYTGEWTTEGLGDGENTFESVAEAESMIEELRSHGDDWAAHDYRVVEVA